MAKFTSYALKYMLSDGKLYQENELHKSPHTTLSGE